LLRKMKVKNYLQQVQKIDAVITNKMIEREQWLTLASSLSGQTDGERVKSSGSNQKMEDSVVMAIDAARDIDKYVARLRDVKSEISEVIQQIPVKEYNVLHKLYIQGKDLDDVAADYKKSYSWASTMHGRALDHVQGVLDTLEALPENSGKYRFRKGLKL
jgi:DNA-directed RNA polymerase specialized sigma subunit